MTGCRCPECRGAEAAYRASNRRQHASGRPPLGSKRSAVEAWRLIKAFKRERFTQMQIARLLGYQRPILEIGKRQVTVRTILKLRRLARLRLFTEGGGDGEASAPLSSHG